MNAEHGAWHPAADCRGQRERRSSVKIYVGSVLDPHAIYADPDPLFFGNAEPDPGTW